MASPFRVGLPIRGDGQQMADVGKGVGRGERIVELLDGAPRVLRATNHV